MRGFISMAVIVCYAKKCLL